MYISFQDYIEYQYYVYILYVLYVFIIYICICVCYRLFYGFQGGPDDCVMHHEKHDLSKNTSIANYIR